MGVHHKLEIDASRRATSGKTLQFIVLERWGSHGVQPGVHEVGPSPRSPPLGIPPLPPSPLPIVLPSHPLPPQYICVPEPLCDRDALLEASGPFTHLEVSAGGGGARHNQSSNAGPPALWPAPLPGEGRPRDLVWHPHGVQPPLELGQGQSVLSMDNLQNGRVPPGQSGRERERERESAPGPRLATRGARSEALGSRMASAVVGRTWRAGGRAGAEDSRKPRAVFLDPLGGVLRAARPHQVPQALQLPALERAFLPRLHGPLVVAAGR